MRAPILVVAGIVSAVVLGTPASVAAQDPGFALRFDGTTDLVRLHPTASMIGASWPSTKTVSVWVNPTGTATCTAASPSRCDAIFGDRPRSWGISRGTLNGQDRIWVWNYDGTFDSLGIEYVPGEWIQVTMVHDNGVLSAYKDGAFVGSVASGPTAQGSSNPVLHFGGIINNASNNWTFEGDIDEVQVWSIARTAQQIADSMSGPLAGNEPGLAAYYRMTNGSGAMVTDDSGRGWTGDLLDGANGVPGNGPIAWVESGAFGGGEPPPPNDPPAAHPQDLTTLEDTPAPIVLTGEDPDGDPLTFRVTAPPAHGVLAGAAPNLTYVPAADYYGLDSFAFVANDGRIDSEPAVVTITVAAVNDAPVANDDAAVTAIDTAVAIPVLGNDSDVDGDILSISAVSQPQHGTAAIDGVYIVYTPAPEFSGADAFTYTITDGQGGYASATVTVTVTPTGADPGYALRFDGASDYVVLARTAHIFGPGWESTKTVSLWVKPEGVAFCSFPSPASCDAIIGDRPRWWGISRGTVGGQDRIWVWNYDGGFKAVGVPYTPGEWVHVALVHGGGLLTAYRNGVAVGSVPSGATQQPTTGALPTLQLGGIINNANANWTFQGEIDEVQLWSAARTAEEIQQDMLWPLFGSEPGLSAYYRMSNGAGTLLTDDSGRGFTGTLTDGGPGVPADGAILWVPSGAFSVTP